MNEKLTDQIFACEALWEGLIEDIFMEQPLEVPFLEALEQAYAFFAPYRFNQRPVERDLMSLFCRMKEFEAVCMPENCEQAAVLSCSRAVLGILTGDTIDCLDDDPPQEEILVAEFSCNGQTYFFRLNMNCLQQSFDLLVEAIRQALAE